MRTFEELGVSEEIRKAIEELGYEHPMPVQEEVIPYLLGVNNDVVALAQTGTGKTAAYGLPVLQKVDPNRTDTQAVILSPTRELCLQIADDLEAYSKYLPSLHVLPVYGGTNIESQIRTLRKGVQVIVATPGRLIDLMERGAASLQHVENVVLDEADEMLSMGFTESIDTILAGVPENHNTLLFSATMSKEIERISKKYLRQAQEIVVGSRNEGAETVNHVYYMVHARDKYLALKRVVDYYPKIYAIIFCRTRLETQEIADKLIQDGYNAEALHGELSQQQRDLTDAEIPPAPGAVPGGYRRGSPWTRCGGPDTRNQLRHARRYGKLHAPKRTYGTCRKERYQHLYHQHPRAQQGARGGENHWQELRERRTAQRQGHRAETAVQGD